MNSGYLSRGITYSVVDPATHSIFELVEILYAKDGVVLGYKALKNLAYYSLRYDKWITIRKGTLSDGATSAPDIDSLCWLFHDELCATGLFDDGTECNNWQASHVLGDILAEEGRWFRARTWFWATWVAGGGKARDNGML